MKTKYLLYIDGCKGLEGGNRLLSVVTLSDWYAPKRAGVYML